MIFKIYQIELTNVCNAKCSYCPHDKMKRKQGFMQLNTLRKALEYMKRNKQKYVALHHMGEPLLHPFIDKAIDLCHTYDIKCEFSTNGKLLDKYGDLILKADTIRVAMDYFNPVAQVYRFKKKYKGKLITHRVTTKGKSDLKKDFDNWAGEVKGKCQMEKGECYFLTKNYGVILWDGRIVNCCHDYDGFDVIGTVDNFYKLKTRKFNLCKNCAGLQFAKDGEWK